MKYAISFAKKHKWKKIILYSNTILKNSIHLYRKYGFIEIKMEERVIYSRGNIKMELDLV
jgi:ribosomal protein S18 acetylase RimI-like enzyme